MSTCSKNNYKYIIEQLTFILPQVKITKVMYVHSYDKLSLSQSTSADKIFSLTFIVNVAICFYFLVYFQTFSMFHFNFLFPRVSCHFFCIDRVAIMLCCLPAIGNPRSNSECISTFSKDSFQVFDSVESRAKAKTSCALVCFYVCCCDFFTLQPFIGCLNFFVICSRYFYICTLVYVQVYALAHLYVTAFSYEKLQKSTIF